MNSLSDTQLLAASWLPAVNSVNHGQMHHSNNKSAQRSRVINLSLPVVKEIYHPSTFHTIFFYVVTDGFLRDTRLHCADRI